MSIFEQQTLSTILCCLCGTQIPANPSNMCVNCIRGQVDITEGIPKQGTIHWCRSCGRYLQPPNNWLACELESRELLTYCIKKIKGLTKVRLVDAGFVWTEPHSRRLKIKLTVQKEVFASTILQQVFIVEFVVQNQMCDKCHRVEAKDTWNAVVQVRQKVEHKRTFFYLEQLILKHNAHATTLGIKERPDGLDFFFGSRSHAVKFVDFLQVVIPVKYKTSEQLISQDDHNNTYNYKYTFSVEIVPLCRDDLICLPSKVASSMGCSSPLVLVYKVSNIIHVIDPTTLTVMEVTTNNYWKAPFRSLCTASQLVEYTVLDVAYSSGPHRGGAAPTTRGKFMLCEVQVARNSDLGANDTTFTVRSHLGHLLRPGDTVLGYDAASGNYNDSDLVAMKGRDLPDVVLVRKVFPNNRKSHRKRHWSLKRLTVHDEEGGDGGGAARKAEDKQGRDYEQFLKDLEEDPEMRSHVLLYKAPGVAPPVVAPPSAASQMVDEGEDDEADPTFPEVGVDELIQDVDQMSLDDSAS